MVGEALAGVHPQPLVINADKPGATRLWLKARKKEFYARVVVIGRFNILITLWNNVSAPLREGSGLSGIVGNSLCPQGDPKITR